MRQAFTPWVMCSLPAVSCCSGRFMVRLCPSLSHPHGCGLRLFAGCVGGLTQPVLGLFFREKCPVCSCRFSAFMGGSEFRVHSVATMVPNLFSTSSYGYRAGASDCLHARFLIPVLDREDWMGLSMGQVRIVRCTRRGRVPVFLGKPEKGGGPGRKAGHLNAAPLHRLESE